jgi:hypothetical protein
MPHRQNGGLGANEELTFISKRYVTSLSTGLGSNANNIVRQKEIS